MIPVNQSAAKARVLWFWGTGQYAPTLSAHPARRHSGPMKTLAAGLTIAALGLPHAAAAAPPIDAPRTGAFRSVLAGGEGQNVPAAELAASQESDAPPARFVDQLPLYTGLPGAAAGLTTGGFGRFYKDTSFGAMPGGEGTTTTPRAGVTIIRDAQFGTAHIWGVTRSDVMFGAGYATAQERLFLMDALRRTARGTLAGLTGAGAARSDARQLLDQDYSADELESQFADLGNFYGDAGARAQQDIVDYVDGINAYIEAAKADPALMPAEYAALGTSPAPWSIADTVAEFGMFVSRFSASGGGEERSAALQQVFRSELGAGWRRAYEDLREAQEPEALTVQGTAHRSDATGRRRPGVNRVPDAGTIRRRDAILSGAGAPTASRGTPRGTPAWIPQIERLRELLPTEASSAVLVSARRSTGGVPLSAVGPQVGYSTPQILTEYELHGGGIDVQGVTFPGAGPWPVAGHGIDFAFGATSGNGDNQDTFVETLCDATHYRYKGQCRAFVMRDQTVTTPVSPLEPNARARTITYRTMRSVHGPVFAFARFNGRRVALTRAKAFAYRELTGSVPLMQIAENQPRDVRQFLRDVSEFPGSENWFYADNREVGFQQSGLYPRHARGGDLDLPLNGNGAGDWVGFDPESYTAEYLPASRRPSSIEPRDGVIVSWNNREAPGWRTGPTDWTGGTVHRAGILEDRVADELRRSGGRTDLTGLTRAVGLAATTDLRGQEIVPLLLAVVRHRTSPAHDRLLALLRTWRAAGAPRLDGDGNDFYDHGAAIALMDAWWPRLVRAQFRPELGRRVFGAVERSVLDLDSTLRWHWTSQVQKDLRATLGRRVLGRYSRSYCGPRRVCAERLLDSLDSAVRALTRRYGSSAPRNWPVASVCGDDERCDQIVPRTAGAVSVAPFPWQDRGTWHQIAEVVTNR